MSASKSTHTLVNGNHPPPSVAPEPDILTVALEIAGQGLPVFPCDERKRPAIAKADGGNGYLDATSEPAAVRALFARAPHAKLVGVPTGPRSGFDALDVDYRNGGGDWERRYLDQLGETRIHGTPSAGRHYLFAHADGVRNSASRIAPGIDVRGAGGYICFPPSPGYTIVHEADIAEWPAWLLELVRKAPEPPPRPIVASDPARITDKRLDGYVQSLLRRVSTATDGHKHDTLRDTALTLGGYKHLLGQTDGQLTALLLNALPDTVADWENAKKTISWGLAEGAKRPLILTERQSPPRGNGPAPPHPEPPETPAPPPLPDMSDAPEDMSDGLACLDLPELASFGRIAPRPWVYGKFLLAGSAAVLGAMDGTGKGFITVAHILALVTGRPLLGEKVWRTGSVGIVTYEDDPTEWLRRIAAACIHYGISYAEIRPRIFFLHRAGGRVVLAQRMADGATIYPDSDAIITTLRKRQAVALVVDPFNSAHLMDDGNSNVLIARVAMELTRIAQVANVAVLVLHHLRKGASGDPDDLMGAVALRANFRSCRILRRMTPTEAEGLEISERDRFRYLRISGGKENYAPHASDATWFKLISVELGNGTDAYPEGDSVAVATEWQPPSPFDGLGWKAIHAILNAIRRGPEEGGRYSPKNNAKNYAGRLIEELGDRKPDAAAAVLATWIENGLLVKEEYWAGRNKAWGLVVNEAAAAGMSPAAVASEDDPQL